MTGARPGTLPGDTRFVIACPTCRGELAALAGDAGRTACCPLCTATFVVPTPQRGAAPLEAASGPAAVVDQRRAHEAQRRLKRGRRNLVFLIAGAAVLVGVVFILATRFRR